MEPELFTEHPPVMEADGATLPSPPGENPDPLDVDAPEPPEPVEPVGVPLGVELGGSDVPLTPPASPGSPPPPVAPVALGPPVLGPPALGAPASPPLGITSGAATPSSVTAQALVT